MYINAENGLQVTSSPDNWSSGWGGRRTVTICDAAGNSYFPGRVQSTSDVRGTIFYDYNNTSYYTDPNSVSQLSRLNLMDAGNGYSLLAGPYDLNRVYNDSGRPSVVINATDYPHLYLNAVGSSTSNTNHGPVISMTGRTDGGYRRF